MNSIPAYSVTPLHTHGIRGDVVREVLIGNKMYNVHTDENGNPVKLSRFNEKHKMFVDITFSNENNDALKKEVEDLLKSLIVNRILGLTQGENSGTLPAQNGNAKEGN